MIKAFGKHEQLYPFADKITDPDALKNDLENWLSNVTAAENGEVLKKAREYIHGLPGTEKTSLFSVKTAPKAKSASHTSKTSASRISETSSQRQRELLLAKHRREENERQNESMYIKTFTLRKLLSPIIRGRIISFL